MTQARLCGINQTGGGSAASNPGLQGQGSSFPFFTGPWDSVQQGWSGPSLAKMRLCVPPLVLSKTRWHGTGAGNCFFPLGTR